jgi:hypothetical protein
VGFLAGIVAKQLGKEAAKELVSTVVHDQELIEKIVTAGKAALDPKNREALVEALGRIGKLFEQFPGLADVGKALQKTATTLENPEKCKAYLEKHQESLKELAKGISELAKDVKPKDWIDGVTDDVKAGVKAAWRTLQDVGKVAAGVVILVKDGNEKPLNLAGAHLLTDLAQTNAPLLAQVEKHFDNLAPALTKLAFDLPDSTQVPKFREAVAKAALRVAGPDTAEERAGKEPSNFIYQGAKEDFKKNHPELAERVGNNPEFLQVDSVPRRIGVNADLRGSITAVENDPKRPGETTIRWIDHGKPRSLSFEDPYVDERGVTKPHPLAKMANDARGQLAEQNGPVPMHVSVDGPNVDYRVGPDGHANTGHEGPGPARFTQAQEQQAPESASMGR